MKKLKVLWESKLIGHLQDVGGRDMSFRYADSYLESGRARPISLSLPLRDVPFAGGVARAWFANLLPEGAIRGHVARKLGISESNEFAILAGIGGDCAGALRLLPETSSPDRSGGYRPLPWEKLEEAIASAPRPSLLALMHDGEMRLSLAGAQDKLPIRYDGGRPSLPFGDAASTHLIKISTGGFPDLVQNELFCLKLAREVGLEAPTVAMAPTETPILLVERYDRVADDRGFVRRLHQEDFCQALGVPPESKYENEGGPSLPKIFDALSRGSRSPLPDKRELIRWVLFNYLIGNADAHAKNISLLYGGPDDTAAPRLAPFYDLVCTRIYDGLASKHAHKIGGEYRPKAVAARHWDRFAEAVGVKAGYLRAEGLGLCGRIEEKAEPLADEIGERHGAREILGRVFDVVKERAGWMKRGMGM